MKKFGNHNSETRKHKAFTLIELLVVIAVIGVIAAFLFSVTGAVKRQQYLKTAGGELEQIKTALENYKAKYGFYPPCNPNSVLLPPLYYELVGTTLSGLGPFYTVLNGSTTIQIANVTNALGVGGFINCTKGAGDDAVVAVNFLPGLKQNRIGTAQLNGYWVTNLITSVRGPDAGYAPLGTADVNPFRYLYPGTHNPNGYDLWIQLVINGTTNLICNWNQQVQINSALP